MSKFGKFILRISLTCAALYGLYYYLRKEEVITPIVDDDDDLDFYDDLDDAGDDNTKERTYINLTFDRAKAEDLAKNAVKKAKSTISDSAKKVEEFFCDEPAQTCPVSDKDDDEEDVTDTSNNPDETDTTNRTAEGNKNNEGNSTKEKEIKSTDASKADKKEEEKEEEKEEVFINEEE